VRHSPGEVNDSSRIKLPPPLPRSRDPLPSGAKFEKSVLPPLCREKIPPLETLRGEISLCGVSVANIEDVKKFPSVSTVRSEISPAGGRVGKSQRECDIDGSAICE